MKFKTNISKEIRHKGTLTCLDWSSSDEIYSCSDDHQIYKWNTTTRESIQVAKLPEDFFPTDLHWLISKTNTGSKGNDSLLITSGDGRFIILNRSARVERNITAHTGAISSGRWSPDGAGLLTSGEDGVIKVWSRSGMLRSTVIQNEGTIRCARWAPNSASIIYAQGSSIAIKPLAANSKLIKWRGHDGLVLSLSLSEESLLIASCGEDSKYKIWDSQGANIFTSSPDDYAITSVDFSPDGQLLAVGGFNMLKLCNCSGWTYSRSRFTLPIVGSVFGVKWSGDGTQIIAGCGNGSILFGHVIEKQKISRNLKATTTGRKSILLEDITTRTTDSLDFSDRIVKWELGYGHLIVATPNQVHIFNENYINTPIIIDGRNDVRIISIGKKNFLIVDNNSIWVYTYTGRLHLNPRYSGSQTQVVSLNSNCISLGLDILVIRDYSDQTVIHVFYLIPGANRQDEPLKIKSKNPVTAVSMCRAGGNDDQYLVFIDVNRDLFLTSIVSGTDFPTYKIGTQVLSVMWASESNILVGLHDSCYSVWYCPGEASSDPTLIALTTLTFETSEFGKNISIENFDGSNITFCSSGILYTVGVKIYCEVLHKCVYDNLWDKALKICRLAQNTILWSTLAAIASKKNQLDITEEAYSAALQIDKVNYLQYIKELPQSGPEQMAENSLMNGRITEAEIILLHNKKISEAISFSIRMHRWDRALEIAEKHNIDTDLVLVERKKYLAILNREEMNQNFIQKSKLI